MPWSERFSTRIKNKLLSVRIQRALLKTARNLIHSVLRRRHALRRLRGRRLRHRMFHLLLLLLHIRRRHNLLLHVNNFLLGLRSQLEILGETPQIFNFLSVSRQAIFGFRRGLRRRLRILCRRWHVRTGVHISRRPLWHRFRIPVHLRFRSVMP